MMTSPPTAPPIIAPIGVGFVVLAIWDAAGVRLRVEYAVGPDGDAVESDKDPADSDGDPDEDPDGDPDRDLAGPAKDTEVVV